MKNKSKTPLILTETWNGLKETFGLPDERSRETKYVAIRAAYCYVLKEMNAFSLAEIGGSCTFKGKDGNIECLDHSTVLWLVNRASDGFYKNIYPYNEALQYMRTIVVTKLSRHIKNSEELKLLRKEIESIDNIKKDLDTHLSASVIKSLSKENDKLSKSVEYLADKMDNLNKKMIEIKSFSGALFQATESISLMNRRISAIGYKTLDTEPLLKLYKKMKEIN